jgi:hypothetical protein
MDAGFSMFDMFSIFWNTRGSSAAGETLPVIPRVTSGGADVLELGPGAQQVISRFAR